MPNYGLTLSMIPFPLKFQHHKNHETNDEENMIRLTRSNEPNFKASDSNSQWLQPRKIRANPQMNENRVVLAQSSRLGMQKLPVCRRLSSDKAFQTQDTSLEPPPMKPKNKKENRMCFQPQLKRRRINGKMCQKSSVHKTGSMKKRVCCDERKAYFCPRCVSIWSNINS